MNWIIGDIHGELEKLNNLLTNVSHTDSNPTIYCVGDYCDRGPDSKGVVDRILKDGIKCIKGNHDDVFMSVFDEVNTGYNEYSSPIEAFWTFAEYGLLDTLASYHGCSVKTLTKRVINHEFMKDNFLNQICAPIPENHREFYRNLPFIIETDDFFLVHGAMIPSCELSLVNQAAVIRKAALWGRMSREMIDEPKVWNKTGYFGHTPTHTYGVNGPLIGNQAVLIDTGAAYGRNLSAICHETKVVLTDKINTGAGIW